MPLNICAISKIADPYNPGSKPFKTPYENDAPLDKLVELYFKNTPCLDGKSASGRS
jgi:hypothetical protein